MEESGSGRLRMGEERLARTQDELESALQADKGETSKNDRGKVNDPALLKPRTGHPNPFSRLTSRPPAKGSVFEGWEGLQNFGGSGALEHRIILANSPVAEDQHTLRVLRDIVLVRDQHNGQSFVVQALEDLHDLDRGPTVEIAGGLIGEENRRVVHQRASDRHPWLLSSGHLRWKVFRAVGKSDHGQRIGGPFVAL